MYSKKTSKELKELYEELLNDENLTSLDDDVAMLRALLTLKLSRIDADADMYDENGMYSEGSLENNI